MSYGLIFSENSSHSTNIFLRQKKVIRTISGIRNRDLCWDYLKKLHFQSQYLLSILMFVVQNMN